MEKKSLEWLEKMVIVPDQFSGQERRWSWKDSSFFTDHRPVCIEYCSGNGEWIVNRALQSDRVNWVAVEKKWKRGMKIHKKRERYRLGNLFVVLGDARVVTKHCFPLSSVERVYVNFPDPWPKRRHAKHRLLNPSFLSEIREMLVVDGELIVVSDHLLYIQQIEQALALSETWVSNPMEGEEKEEYGSSYFDRLWREKGKEIYFLSYKKKREL